NEKLQKKRTQHIKELEEKRKAICIRFKRIPQIEAALSQTAIATAKAILNGKNTKEELTKLKEINLKLQNELKEILKKASLPTNYLELKYDCEKCKDTGYIDGKMCTCLKNMLRAETYNQLNALSPLSLSTFDSFDLHHYEDSNRVKMEKILNYCIEYAKNFTKNSDNLFMNGATGLGKTHLSLAIANELIKKGVGVIYVSTPNIVTKLEKEKFRYNEEWKDNTESHLVNCDLLILDDLGTEFQTTFSNATIYNIINSRILYDKPTIISSNMSPQKIQNSYSERLVSRLWGHYKLISFCGKDIRSKIGTEKAKIFKKGNAKSR
ncbi:MAG: ATP-binding protein, partial [Clostridia bacterium]|nr:ATP-binding protein [Clostridia bacterium]